MTTAVILNLKQARILADSQILVDRVISFCPNASEALKEAGYQVISTANVYAACSHARVVVAAAKEMQLLTDAAKTQYHLNDLEQTAFATYIHNYLCCAYHLYYCLRALKDSENSYIWAVGNKPERGGYEAMITGLAKDIGNSILSYAYRDYSAPHYYLANFYNRILFYCAKRSKHTKMLDYGDELPKRVFKAMVENGGSIRVFNLHTVCRNAYKTTHFFVKSLARLSSQKHDNRPIYIFRATHPAKYRAAVSAFIIPNMVGKILSKATVEVIEETVPFIRAETIMGRDIVRHLQPAAAVSEHAIYAHVLGGLHELRGQGGKHAMINHATHTLQHGALSRMATLSWGSQQHIISPYTTHALPKSPLTAALYPEVRADNEYGVYRINVYGKVNDKTENMGKFVILQAGNYTDPYHHVPWCKETADEYLLATYELLEEVGKLDNVELIIKLKNKKSSTHKKLVEAHIQKLGIADKARVDTTGKFSDLMARAHLMVCNLSGTIEEALSNHIPVMFHSYRKTYFHLDEQVVKSSEINGLAPAYLVKHRNDIGAIITKLSGLRSQLRNPVLFKNVAWGEGELISINAFAQQLLEDAATKEK